MLLGSRLQVAQLALGVGCGGLLTKDGHVFCWGSGEGGQLGLSLDDIPTPTPLEALEGVCGVKLSMNYGSGGIVTDRGTGCVSIKSGLSWFVSGSIYTWGRTNSFSSLPPDTPTIRDEFEGLKVQDLAFGTTYYEYYE